MNCKPGDLAWIVWPVSAKGRLCRVIHAVPEEDFRMPDGYMCAGLRSLREMKRNVPGFAWFIELLGAPTLAVYALGGEIAGKTATQFGVYFDPYLRPLNGDSQADETETPTQIIREVADATLVR